MIEQIALQRGLVIPACPLALTAARKLDERRQRALLRYYATAGAGGIAVAVHTTQFAIREPRHGLFKPVLQLAAEEMHRLDSRFSPSLAAKGGEGKKSVAPLVRIGGVCGDMAQAIEEASLLREFGYHAGLLSLAALKDADEDRLISHCQKVATIIPIIGFYLQPTVGGRVLPFSFWRRFAEIPNVLAIKIAPFNRYQTLDVVRAVAESGRDDIALYTGNDDNIVLDLLTPYRFTVRGQVLEKRIVGGLLGHWAVWTKKAVELLDACHQAVSAGNVPAELLQQANEITDCNAAFFDAANGFKGCIAGLHEVLRRQGLFEGLWCLDPGDGLSPGQREEIDRIYAVHPHLNDDAFVEEHRDEWLR
jgi:hypothetical protein